jgi:hypothetical protein
MKSLTVLLLSFISLNLSAQFFVDSVSIDQFSYDSTVVDNEIWQIGQTDKIFFDNEWVLVIDTTNMYNTDVDASIDMVLTRQYLHEGYVVSFDHKMDTDTNAAGGYFEINLDNDSLQYEYEGQTYSTWWLKFRGNPEASVDYAEVYSDYEMYTDQGHLIPISILSIDDIEYNEFKIEFNGYHDTLFNDEIAYTGTYDKWNSIYMEFMYQQAIKTSDNQDTLNFRFHFESNNTSNGKNGWAIKNIKTGTVGYGGTNENTLNENNILTFPNPTTNLTTAIINNPNNDEVVVIIYALDGIEIKTFKVYSSEIEINLSKLKAGTYLVDYSIDGTSIGNSRLIKK